MSIETGSKYDGKVTGITHFGAFVELPGGKTGLVHISEVADSYVKDIKDHLSVGDTVTVKVVKIQDDGKIALSIKKAADKPPGEKGRERPETSRQSDEQSQSTFEDKMSRFLKDSEDRLSTLKKQTESKRGGRSTKR
ncbi:S1 domain-containing RNA-binding protein [Salisediminibacterium halotolerans]|uniref:S1 RNA binding domain protein n=1 Tax=Salisediminibacterium halotolerans TaxID=517425 RepID=A0A1H9VT87_9BACI|nr:MULTISPECIES: S1 domain-containing RNA-binding protein [Salisediminibacterium]RLJ80945.1 S1 RNA binding domain protein [Actinophytocola xinjiangensis]RPE83650.1 S1 RNA binding domain protein [Salisediminibacterium halotolerans]TWG37870.1 S1 RNA binding domain protein [Salisediminibacterium halotolerans]SES24503.1 S1 RNA binding domain protein [Salisediminibacterium haloalkalitolerans]GEL07002.1 hypothetical protein SHA02_04180 [Salisediminibacterium halotolerans]